MTDNDENNEMRTPIAGRQRLMRICAQATVVELERALADCSGLPAAEDVRSAEEGLIMLRGRIGGTGAPFNHGEATVTRAVIRLSDGTLGYSYPLGRTPEKARLDAALSEGNNAADFLHFHTGVKFNSAPEEANIVLISDPASAPSLATFAQGMG